MGRCLAEAAKYLSEQIVSIQLVSPASGELQVPGPGTHGSIAQTRVSIQLVSPASGELKSDGIFFLLQWISFHSISFPSEWGGEKQRIKGIPYPCFHSISFPSEWGGDFEDIVVWPDYFVSIQLVSPASGESCSRFRLRRLRRQFPFN